MVLSFLKIKVNYALTSIILFVTQILISFISIKSFDYFNVINYKQLLFSFALGITTFILEYLLGSFFGKSKTNPTKKANAIFIFCILLLPISEEIYFRVFMLEQIQTISITNLNINVFFVLISAVVLVINHIQALFDKAILIQKFLIEGLLLSTVFVLQKNIWVTIIAHEVFNVINLVYYYKIGGIYNE